MLDYPAEVFYRRLLNVVDDHGLFDARPNILRASLYPLRLDRVREADISRWLVACQTAGLILLYEAENKPYLKVLNTQWDARSKPKYPVPDGHHLKTPENNCAQLQTDANKPAQLSVSSYSDSYSSSQTKKGDSGGNPPENLTLAQALASVMGMAELPEGKPGEPFRIALEEFRHAGINPADIPVFAQEWYSRKVRSGQTNIVLTVPILRQDLPAWVKARQLRAKATATPAIVKPVVIEDWYKGVYPKGEA